MSGQSRDSTALLDRALLSGRIHSGYLLAGEPVAARDAALRFARALVCEAVGRGDGLCEACDDCNACRRSRAPEDEVAIDASGKKGPLYRHIGDHPDLFWVDRGSDSTRVRIGQIRAIQNALRLGSHEGGRRAIVIADAEWLNVEAQNALLRVLEEPPAQTTLVFVAASAASVLATIRSRCQRVLFPVPRQVPLREGAEEDVQHLSQRLDALREARVADLLDWAEEYRGDRATAAEKVQTLLAVSSAWLHERAVLRATGSEGVQQASLDAAFKAFRTVASCRRDLAQRNANPQMVAERALFGLREAAAR